MKEANSSLYGSVSLVLDALRTSEVGLGVRHVRERIVLPSINATQADYQRTTWPLIAALGIDFTCEIGTPDGHDGTVAEFASYIRDGLQGDSGLIRVIENSNEPNGPTQPWNIVDPDRWVGLVRARQEQMAMVFRSDPSLSLIRLAGPSLSGGAGMMKYQALGDLLPNVDIGNFHYYPGNRQQSKPSVELDQILQGVAINARGKPVICTETGMHTGAASSPMSYYPEWVAGVYMPRVPLEQFRRGITRVFMFELLDSHSDPSEADQTAHFGLLRYNTSSLEPKPAYHSLKRLLDMLRDGDAIFTPNALGMRVANAPADYRQLLFQKSNGRHYLCMWRDISIWDQHSNLEILITPVAVQVRLDASASINVFRPDQQTERTATLTNTRAVTVALSGSVCVLEII